MRYDMAVSTQSGADRAENFKLLTSCEWVYTCLLHALSNQESGHVKLKIRQHLIGL